MATFNFKSSGTRIDDRSVSADKVTKKQRDIGIKTPLTATQPGKIFDMHQDPIDQVKDNLKNLILTNAGERLGLYDFGADLNVLVFEFTNNDAVESEITERIQAAINKYMSGVQIKEISAVEIDRNEKEETNNMALAKIRLKIVYDLPSIRIGNQSIEVTLQGGGWYGKKH